MRPVWLISKTPYEGVNHLPILSTVFLNPSIDFSPYDGIVFTSKQGIDALDSAGIDRERVRCLCVSDATAVHARKAGYENVLTAEGYGESIPPLLANEGENLRWLYARPETVATDWIESAKEMGIRIDEAVVYETRCNPDADCTGIENDAVLIFTSPSTVRCFENRHPILPTHRIVAIGKTTAAAFRSGIAVVLSETPSIESAVEMARRMAGDV